MEKNLVGQAAGWVAHRFVKAEAVVQAVLLALVAKKNCLFWGPGGHGKSEMSRSLLNELLGLGAPIKTFGGGTREEDLFGGIDFKRFKEAQEMAFRFTGCWMDHPVAIFEELFDAPPKVLTSLKNTLTAGRYEDDRGEEYCHTMATRTIVGLTNLEPAQVADQGPDVAALVERFPVQLRVAWGSYAASDFLEMFRTVGNDATVDADTTQVRQLLSAAQQRYLTVNADKMMPILAELIAKARQQAEISPRTAMHALGLCKASAALAGRDEVTKEDLLSLTFLPGMEAIAADIGKELEAAVARAEAEEKLAAAERRMTEFLAELGAAETPVKCLQVSVRLDAFGDEVAKLKITDGMIDRRKQLRDAVVTQSAVAATKAKQVTRV